MHKKDMNAVAYLVWQNIFASGFLSEIDLASNFAERENHWFFRIHRQAFCGGKAYPMIYVSTIVTRKIKQAVKATSPVKRSNGQATGSIAFTESMMLEKASRSIRLRDGGEFTSGTRRGQKASR